MRNLISFLSLFFFISFYSCNGGTSEKLKKEKLASVSLQEWDGYFPGTVIFIDKAKETKGSEIYNTIITDPSHYITESALTVLKTLYFSPKDSIPKIKTITYTLEDIDAISFKSGSGDYIKIVYSTRWIEKSFVENDTLKLDYETKGVLLHELTHAYQLEPQGCGTYSDGGAYWAFIEGMADAVRVANGYFTEEDRPKGGTYLSGYRTTGFFLYWVNKTKDKDFIKKFNQTALSVVPWSFEDAFKHIFGTDTNYHIDVLWKEYMIAMGDISEDKNNS